MKGRHANNNNIISRFRKYQTQKNPEETTKNKAQTSVLAKIATTSMEGDDEQQ